MNALAAPEPPIAEDNARAHGHLRPAWLRPLATALVIAAHVGALGGFLWFAAERITPLDEIRVEIVPQGETVTETRTVPTPEAAPVISAEPAVLASPDPEMRDDPQLAKPVEQMAQDEPVPDLALPEPKIDSPQAPPLPIDRPKPQRINKAKRFVEQQRVQVKKAEIKEALHRAALRALKRAKAEAHARRRAAQAQLGAAAIRAGVKEGAGEANVERGLCRTGLGRDQPAQALSGGRARGRGRSRGGRRVLDRTVRRDRLSCDHPLFGQWRDRRDGASDAGRLASAAPARRTFPRQRHHLIQSGEVSEQFIRQKRGSVYFHFPNQCDVQIHVQPALLARGRMPFKALVAPSLSVRPVCANF